MTTSKRLKDSPLAIRVDTGFGVTEREGIARCRRAEMDMLKAMEETAPECRHCPHAALHSEYLPALCMTGMSYRCRLGSGAVCPDEAKAMRRYSVQPHLAEDLVAHDMSELPPPRYEYLEPAPKKYGPGDRPAGLLSAEGWPPQKVYVPAPKPVSKDAPLSEVEVW